MYLHELEDHDIARKARRPRSAPFPGVSPEYWPTFDKYLKARGLNPALARENKWYPSISAGDSEPRIVIPATNTTFHGYWQARAMTDVEKRYQSPAVPRGDSLIVVWPVGLHPERVAVVEGPMDALAAADVENTVGIALMGNQPNDKILSHVTMISSSLPILVVGDSDAMREATQTVAALAMRGRNTKLVMLNGAKDIAELNLDQRRKVLIG